ncbi:MAG: carbon storage regulator [Candidatus Eisenbacteria bacterium]|nr:carbon storage regulator [Candidatus Eisenbacteria bacterium]
MKRSVREKEIGRRAGESVLIGDAVEIRVEKIEKDRVRLRVWAPEAAGIAPRELVEEIAAENRSAALSRIPGMDDLCAVQGEEEA